MEHVDKTNLLGVLLVDAGLAAGLLGLAALLRPRTRKRGAALLAAGAVSGLAGVALPAPLRRAPASSKPQSALDEILPAWQFREFHEQRIQAPPAAVYRALWEVRGDEILLLRTLTWLRAPRLPRGARRPASILNPGRDRPILEVATSSGFALLADRPDREVVVGTCVLTPSGVGPRAEAGFAGLDAPGYAKAAMNFRMVDEGGGWTRLTTETRVHATDRWTRLRFAAYWRLIYPGSAFIRRMWLRAIAQRAEARRATG